MSYMQDARDADASFRADGQLITITRTVKGGYSNGRVTTTQTAESAWGIETAVTSRDYGIGTEKGTLVKAGDRKLLLSPFTDDGLPLTEPEDGDVVTFNGQTYTVKFHDRTSPAGVVVMYSLIVRI